MDKMDKEALKSNYKGMDELDKIALDVKWFDEYHEGFDDEFDNSITPLQLMQVYLNHAH